MATVCEIIIGGRNINIQFIILPDAENNRTLLGADFLEKAGIVLNMAQRYWYFEDDPMQHYDFAKTGPVNLIETVKVANVTPRRRMKVKQPRSEAYVSEFESYGPEIPNSDYSPHSIQAIFKDVLPPDALTPKRQAEPALFPGLVYKRNHDDDDDFMRICSMNFKVLKSTDGVSLDAQQKQQLDAVLQANAEVFGNISEPTPHAEHRIDTGNHEPIFSPPYRLSFAKTRELKAEVDKMIEADIVAECESPWASPVVMVPKRTGGIRVCIDYRKINAVTVPDRYPLPRMDDLLHAAKSTKYMTTLDLQSGYYQIKVNDKDSYKTCFITPFGTYLFKRMPFGLRNAPATFQRLMDRFKASVPKVQLLVYLDDLIVCSPSFLDHLKDLDVVLSKLQEYKLRINNSKSRFYLRASKVFRACSHN